MEYMELKICTSDKCHRYYKHTTFCQNPRGDPKFLVDLTWNDPYDKLNEIQCSLRLPEHHVKQDEPTRWNSSLYMLESVMEQKMALAVYGADGCVSVLTSSQLDTATKVINILTRIKEITKNISAYSSTILLI